MLQQLLHGVVLLSFNVAIFGLILSWIVRTYDIKEISSDSSLFVQSWFLIRIAVMLILAHLLQILFWAGFYTFEGIAPDIETAFYFSAVTYATIGYGDIVPPYEWRLLAAIEGLTGILMCAWSGGFFFAVISRLYKERNKG